MRRLAVTLALVAIGISPADLRAAELGPRSLEVAIDPGFCRIDGPGGRLRLRVGGAVADWCRIEGTLGQDWERDSALNSMTLRTCMGSFEREGVFFIVGYGHGWGHGGDDPRGDRDGAYYEIGLGSGGWPDEGKRLTSRVEMTLSGCDAADRQLVPAITFGFGWLFGGRRPDRL